MLHTLRKTKAHVSLHYQHSFSNNLYAENIAAEIAETITLSFDLNCNLRGRNKQTNTYVDAKDLADGDIDELETFQFDDKRVIVRISEMASRLNATPEIWRLIVQLDGEYRFDVRPEYREQHTYRSITLHVISNARNTK